MSDKKVDCIEELTKVFTADVRLKDKKSSKVVRLYSKNEINADSVLDTAEGAYDSVLVLGWDKHGLLDAAASSDLKHSDILWLIESFKMRLINGDYQD